MPKIEIEIGGNNDDLERKIAEAEILVKNLRKDMAKEFRIGNIDAAEKIQQEVNQAKASLKGLQTEFVKTTQSTQTFSKGAVNGGNALMQFSRIAQDAPFGIMGIGNNITATAESFGYLSKSAGGTGAALKAVASSMMGTGGILLAVSLVTTALTYMSQKGITMSDVFDKLTGSSNAAATALKNAAIEGAKSAAEETSNLKGLIAIAQDENQARKNRLAAIDELQKKYPAYFGNLTKEQIMTNDLTNTVNELSKALINRAIAAKMSEAAVEPTLKLWQANAKLLSQKAEIAKLEAAATDQIKNGTNANENYFLAITKAKSGLSETRNEIKSLTGEVAKYQKIIDMASKASSSLLIKTPPNGKDPKEEKTFETPQVDGLVNSIVPSNLADLVGARLDTQMPKIMVAVDTSLQEYQLMLMEFNSQANDLIEGAIVGTFSNLGTAIGEALASGQNVFSAIGNSLLQSMGTFLSDMGGLLIEYGTLAILKGTLDTAIATGGPVAIAAGVAAIAVGVALKAAGGFISAKAKGGISGSTSTSTGGSSNNYSGGYNGGYSASQGGGNVVFEISGQKLIGVLSNTLNGNSRLGGAVNIG